MQAKNLFVVSVVLIIAALVTGIVLISLQSIKLQSDLSSIRADLASFKTSATKPCVK